MHQSGGKAKPVLRWISPNFSIIDLFQIIMGRLQHSKTFQIRHWAKVGSLDISNGVNTTVA